MAALERQARAPMGFVAASTGPEGAKRIGDAENIEPPSAANPDEIDVDGDL